MHILITGATGRIGANLTMALLARGHTVRGFVYPADASRVHKLDGVAGVEIVTGDLRTADDVSAALDGVEAVYHLAAAFGGPFDNLGYLEVNARGTLNLLEAVRQRGLKLHRFIYASTEAIYWRLDQKGRLFERPITEEMASPTHQMPYFLTKWMGEELCTTYFYQYGIPTTSFRFATVFEPSEFLNEEGLPRPFTMSPVLKSFRDRQNPSEEERRVLTDLERQWSGKERLLVQRNPDGRSCRQQWCDVRDIVQGLVLGLERDAAVGQAFTLAGLTIVWERDVTKMAERFGVEVADVRMATPNFFEFDLSKIRRLLYYQPQHGLNSLIDTALAIRRGEKTDVVPTGVRWGTA
ncbi:MAG: hypothetical protein A3F84_13740 [Candidatus Handelsmanbacteria bacterium RIFCSPLOWO2_12_FULL_64_10]|uniref:NAD-dependent epimerase/dehydratase domain-containing protein n=1 Tax=Handelsmanbacteria sp. (strain RIFCSPLOWO2_12_FULL_64_10) TaxID=1817868 RepID=A0A1F6CL48_HANXR|nr:MAG: hypothetical protein A3F84_13740 [Candidatus Handelsmanbacteria bacterium RIFCSPLOWO2_12_FULL_64_10]